MKARRPMTALDRLAAASYKAPVVSGVTRLISMPGTKIEDGTIIGDAKIATESISGDLLVEGSIEADRLGVSELSAITADLGSITAGSLEAVTITGSTLQTATEGARVVIDSEGIRGINASAEEQFNFDTTTGILTATAVISSLTGSQINTEHLAGQITETQIEDDSISTPKLQANSVTAAEINVGEISAISANIGSVMAGTLTGATFRTSAEGARTQIDAAEGFRQFDIDGTTVLTHIPADGSDAVFKGEIQAEGVRLGTGEALSNRIVWEDDGGVDRARLFGSSSVKARLRMQVNQQSPLLEEGEFSVVVGNADNAASAPFFTVQASEASRQIRAGVGANPDITLVNQSGESDFPQLPSTSKRVINRGSSTVTFNNDWFSSTATIEHGLGVTPTAVVACGQDRAVNYEVDPNDFTSATFTVRGRQVETSDINATYDFTWIAMT